MLEVDDAEVDGEDDADETVDDTDEAEDDADTELDEEPVCELLVPVWPVVARLELECALVELCIVELCAVELADVEPVEPLTEELLDAEVVPVDGPVVSLVDDRSELELCDALPVCEAVVDPVDCCTSVAELEAPSSPASCAVDAPPLEHATPAKAAATRPVFSARCIFWTLLMVPAPRVSEACLTLARSDTTLAT